MLVENGPFRIVSQRTSLNNNFEKIVKAGRRRYKEWPKCPGQSTDWQTDRKKKNNERIWHLSLLFFLFLFAS